MKGISLRKQQQNWQAISTHTAIEHTKTIKQTQCGKKVTF